MQETLRMMRSLILGYEKCTGINDLLLEYKQTQQSNIIAYIFVQNYGLLNNMCKKYYLIDNDDVVSFILQEIDKAIMNYDLNSNCKFSSFLITCINNRLRAEQQCLFHNVRKVNILHDNIDNYYNIESNFEFNTLDFSNCGLTSTENIQINLILNGYSVAEIANMLGVTKVTIYKRNKIISKKIVNEV